MFRQFVLAAALAAALLAAQRVAAADERDLAQIREQIRQMKDEYEVRIRALEARVQQAEARAARAADDAAAVSAKAGATNANANAASTAATAQSAALSVAALPPAALPQPATSGTAAALPPAVPQANSGGAGANAFNPAMSLILGGSYARLSQDPNRYRIQGFIPGGGDVGPGARSFNVGESELTLSANIDPRFYGQFTAAVAPDNAVSVEEAFIRTQGLAHGVNLMAGRFLSGIGYLNGQHAHAWDFVDAPLAYQAFFGSQYRNDGLQLKWLAPTNTFVELGIETGHGASFPGTDRNRNGIGSIAAFVHAGDDFGDSVSWRAGVSYLRNRATDRSYDDINATGAAVTNAFSGNSGTWVADAIVKWAPNGNATQTNLKLQAEYLRRTERGTMSYDTLAQSRGPVDGRYDATQSGFYVQGVYQFMPQWRVGVRYDKLYSGTPAVSSVADGTLLPSDFFKLLSYNPSRGTAMVDWSPSEFSRIRLQLARDQARPGSTDNQLFLQYIMSLGVHGAHAF